MSDYFLISFGKRATLLDASNSDRAFFSLFSHHKSKPLDIINGKVQIGYDEPCGSTAPKQHILKHELNRENYDQYLGVVVSGGGSTGSINNIFQYIKSNGSQVKKEVIMPTPIYPGIIRSVKINQLIPVFYETKKQNNYQPTRKGISKFINKNTAAIFITSPGNPYCNFIKESELKKIIKLAQKSDILVILDAVFEESGLNLPIQKFFTLTNHKKLIKIKGLSKDRPFMNDLRIGWAISSDKKIIKFLEPISQAQESSVSVTDDWVAQEDMSLRCQQDTRGLDNKDISKNSVLDLYSKELSSYFKTINLCMTKSVKLLNSKKCIKNIKKPEAGNILFIEVNNKYLSKHGVYTNDDLYNLILNKTGIGVTPGHVFRCNKNCIGFRATISKDPKDFINYLNKIVNLLS